MCIRDAGIILVTKIGLKQVYISIVETCLYFHAIFRFRNLSTIFKVLNFTGRNNKTMRSLHVISLHVRSLHMISSRLAIPKISVTYLFSPVIQHYLAAPRFTSVCFITCTNALYATQFPHHSNPRVIIRSLAIEHDANRRTPLFFVDLLFLELRVYLDNQIKSQCSSDMT